MSPYMVACSEVCRSHKVNVDYQIGFWGLVNKFTFLLKCFCNFLSNRSKKYVVYLVFVWTGQTKQALYSEEIILSSVLVCVVAFCHNYYIK